MPKTVYINAANEVIAHTLNTVPLVDVQAKIPEVVALITSAPDEVLPKPTDPRDKPITYVHVAGRGPGTDISHYDLIEEISLKKPARLVGIDALTQALIDAVPFFHEGKTFLLPAVRQVLLISAAGASSIAYPVSVPATDGSELLLSDAADVASFASSAHWLTHKIVVAGQALRTQVAAATTAVELDAIVDTRAVADFDGSAQVVGAHFNNSGELDSKYLTPAQGPSAASVFTFRCILRPTLLGSRKSFVTFHNGTTQGWGLEFSDGFIHLINNHLATLTTLAVEVGKTYYVAISNGPAEGLKIRLAELGSVLSKHDAAQHTFTFSGSVFTLGGNNGPIVANFTGRMRDAAYWTREFLDVAIAADYAGGNVLTEADYLPDSNLDMYFPLKDAGTPVRNAAPGGHDLSEAGVDGAIEYGQAGL